MFNNDVVQISEILSPAKAGRTQPFLCRGEDGNLYYVKGAHTGRRGQVAEWIGSCLALEFGLPAAKCGIVEISKALIDICPDGWKKIGHGYAFGSLVVDEVLEISFSNVAKIPTKIKQDILIFDWWIENADRTLTEHGGNPNLLWDVNSQVVVVIDHNMAFDVDFNHNDFLETHIFREEMNLIFGDFLLRKHYEEKIYDCLSVLDKIWDQMPEEWLWIGEGLQLNLGREMISARLNKCKPEFLWKVAR